MLKEIKLGKSPRLSGRLPLSMFLLRLRDSSSANRPSSVGIVASKLLRDKSKLVKPVSNPKEDGMLPVRPALETRSHFNDAKVVDVSAGNTVARSA